MQSLKNFATESSMVAKIATAFATQNIVAIAKQLQTGKKNWNIILFTTTSGNAVANFVTAFLVAKQLHSLNKK